MRNRVGRFFKDVTEDIIRHYGGDSQTVRGVVLLSEEHVRELGVVAYEVAKLPCFRRWNKAGLYHVAESASEEISLRVICLCHLLMP